eukprot:7005357-Pyramimonas_sp.AAC.1
MRNRAGWAVWRLGGRLRPVAASPPPVIWPSWAVVVLVVPAQFREKTEGQEGGDDCAKPKRAHACHQFWS